MQNKFIYPILLITLFSFTSCDNSLHTENYGAEEDSSLDASITISGTNVMLQGFDWTSNSDSRTGSTESWYEVIESNKNQISDAFEYVWFPPASDSLSSNGYLPKKLNVLNSKYGTEQELKSAINSISPAKAIGDIVINHRVGNTSWGDFSDPSFGTVKGQNYQAICSDDEGFSNDEYMKKVSSSMRGAKDTGDRYGSGRDLDHTNETVQSEIVTWMNSVMKSAGFVGWRYDYVRGFSGKYVGYYNAMTEAEFSVGELWPDGFSTTGNQWTDKMTSWIDSTEEEVNGVTGIKSRVFDFVLKGMLNSVFGQTAHAKNSNYGLLSSSSNLFQAVPSHAVTFVDNHDTGSTQSQWPLDPYDVGSAYVLILTHPGYPCVAWQHYFTSTESDDSKVSANKAQYLGGKTVPGTNRTYKNHIRYLISLRADAGINEEGSLSTEGTNASHYIATITGTKGTLRVVLGSGISEEEGFTKIYEGTDFQIFRK